MGGWMDGWWIDKLADPHQSETVYFRPGCKHSQNPRASNWDHRPGSGPNEAQVPDVSSQKEFSETQSDRYEVDLFREKHIPQTRLWAIAEGSVVALKRGMVSFYGLGNFIG